MLVVTPNLCFDRTVFLSQLERGAITRARSVTQTAGGKGVNVARVLRTFGIPAHLIGLFAVGEVERLRALLAAEDIDATVVPVEAAQGRTAMILVEPEGVLTVVNEPGELPVSSQWNDLVAAVRDRVAGHQAIVCSGSLPVGAPEDGYAELVELGHANQALTILDTAPAPLRAALDAHPDLVTPNLDEAEAALDGGDGESFLTTGTTGRERALEAANRLVRSGARRAAVTVGASGVAFAGESSAWWIPTFPVEVVSPIGAGDSFVGGILLRDLAPQSPDTEWVLAIERGIATAAASCERQLAGGVDPRRVDELLGGVGLTTEVSR